MIQRFSAFPILMLLAGLLAVAGCSNQHRDQLVEFADRAEQAVEDLGPVVEGLRDEAASAREALADADPDSKAAEVLREAASKAESALAKAVEHRDTVKQAIRDANDAIAAIDAGEDPSVSGALELIGAGASTASGYVPPPWGAILGAVGLIASGVGGMLAKRKSGEAKTAQADRDQALAAMGQSDEASRSLAKAIASVKESQGGVIDFNDERTVRALRSAMTPAARRKMDEAADE